MVKIDHLLWHHICDRNRTKHTWDLYENRYRSVLGQLGNCACTAKYTLTDAGFRLVMPLKNGDTHRKTQVDHYENRNIQHQRDKGTD